MKDFISLLDFPADTLTRILNRAEMKEIKELFAPFQVTEKHLAKLKASAIFLPCPPVTRGQEVSSEAMLSKHCLNPQAKDCLLHAQNAIMEFIIEGR